ncbi:triadin isoform X2 [Folsomia candida]|uniref:triadin isoform X2 n=1 Tax=Folsomia candida TaxID=158441 RepID=UPI001605315D|nr:triadin isoform X2 [Folsomia candida]
MSEQEPATNRVEGPVSSTSPPPPPPPESMSPPQLSTTSPPPNTMSSSSSSSDEDDEQEGSSDDEPENPDSPSSTSARPSASSPKPCSSRQAKILLTKEKKKEDEKKKREKKKENENKKKNKNKNNKKNTVTRKKRRKKLVIPDHVYHPDYVETNSKRRAMVDLINQIYDENKTEYDQEDINQLLDPLPKIKLRQGFYGPYHGTIDQEQYEFKRRKITGKVLPSTKSGRFKEEIRQHPEVLKSTRFKSAAVRREEFLQTVPERDSDEPVKLPKYNGRYLITPSMRRSRPDYEEEEPSNDNNYDLEEPDMDIAHQLSPLHQRDDADKEAGNQIAPAPTPPPNNKEELSGYLKYCGRNPSSAIGSASSSLCAARFESSCERDFTIQFEGRQDSLKVHSK